MHPHLPPTPPLHSRERSERSEHRLLLRDPLAFYLALTQQVGDLVCYRSTPELAFLVNHPDHIRHVLVENHSNYTKDTYINHMFKTMVGDGLLTSEGEAWRRQRRFIQPAFHPQRLARLDALVTSQVAAMLARWEAASALGQPLNLAHEMSALTLAITTQALFGVDLGEDVSLVGHAVDMGGALLARPKDPRFRQGLQVIDDIVHRIILSRRAGGAASEASASPRDDLLGAMMSLRDPATGLGWDDSSLRHQVITLLLAGYETTASALSWTFYLLSQNPDVVGRLRLELGASLGGRPPVYADLPSLPYTRQVFEESLRLYPPAWILGRVALEDDHLGEYTVPAGTILAISPYTVHRRPASWDDPERFVPARPAPTRFTYIPFGAGPRQCIGKPLALMEAQLIIAMVVQRFDLALVPDHEIKPEVVFVLRPDRQMKVTLTPATGSPEWSQI